MHSISSRRFLFALLTLVAMLVQAGLAFAAPPERFSTNGNRLAYLDRADPFHAGIDFPKLTTPQWVGEPGVDEVIIFGVDDMSDVPRYEKFLRPLLDRLKQIDGRAPVSIFSNSPNPTNSHLQEWLDEGLTFEVHTLDHPCPILAGNAFSNAVHSYFGCVDLLNSVPGNKPVAFRTPCCDSIDSASPRLMAELLCGASPKGNYLQMDSSVVMLLTTNDPALPASDLVDAPGKPRFTKYVPFKSFTTTIENYPYPYIIDHLLWEMPFPAPSDWESFHIQGNVSPQLTEDWKAAIDLIARKQGTFTFVFHPHGWSSSAQLVELVDYADKKYGSKVKFLNFKEALDRLNANLLSGQPLRGTNGEDNGVRLLDLNNDGYMDVVIGNPNLRKSRVWNPATRSWNESGFPASLVKEDGDGNSHPAGVRFGIVRPHGFPTILNLSTDEQGAWTFDGSNWQKDGDLLRGLEIRGEKITSMKQERDNGVRFRDIDADGICELLVSNNSQNKIFKWNEGKREWILLDFDLPSGVPIVNEQGLDNGVRFIDLNEDGFDDLIYSNEKSYGVFLYVSEPFLGFGRGWSRKVTEGSRKDANAIPAFVREGLHRNNGSWFHSRHLWVQNENTAALPDLVDRRSFDELLIGLKPLPKSPEESTGALKVPAGFKAELVVSEPLVQSPVAFDWDAQGRLWVVEMRDYPMGLDGKGRPGGVIKRIEDTDSDGQYDKATEFLTGLNFPTGLMCWRNGLLISAAPDILFAEDTDGDGVADVKKVLFTGFREGNQQHRVNGFELGLDGWVYGANGDSGGNIRVVSNLSGQGDLSPDIVHLKASDFRFNPDTGVFQAIEGETQFGRHRDDWGNWFGNANYTWLWQYNYPSHYLARNPHLAVRQLRTLLAQYEGAAHLFPISKPLQRPNAVGEENHVTSANSPTPYRDELFGPAFANSIFISEPSENVIHREVLHETGNSTFRSSRAEGETNIEFIASSDNFFRPAQLKTGPDGALYIADMYRGTIEHPEWIPQDLQARMDLRAGEGLGRIYRIYPEDKSLRRIPRLDRLDSTGLVAAMDHPNGWQRDTAMRLIVERNARDASPALEKLVRDSSNPKARVQALCTLGLLGSITPDVLLKALEDRHPGVRRHAIRLSEPFLRQPSSSDPHLLQALIKRTSDEDPHVALQLALTLGDSKDKQIGNALIELAMRHKNDEVIQQAVLSSALPHYKVMIDTLPSRSDLDSPPSSLIEQLLNLALVSHDDEALSEGVKLTLRLSGGNAEEIQFNIAAALVKSIQRKSGEVAERAQVMHALNPLLKHARAVAFDPGAETSRRISAIKTLRIEPGDSRSSSSIEELSQLISPRSPLEVQRAVLDLLKRADDPATADWLLSRWSGLSPSIRGEVLDVLLSNQSNTGRLLSALESGTLAIHDINTIVKQRLLRNSDTEIRERAGKLFVDTRSDRAAVLKDYETATALKGDAERGRSQFALNCSACHRLGGVGFNVGPDLATMGDKSPATLLTAILDPNRTVVDQFINYSVVTRDDREISGIIANESPNSITLRAANGVEETLLRSDIARLASTQLSLMPEGFENSLNPTQMADLLAFIASSSLPPKSFPGNSPARVVANQSGELHLTAPTAAIYGESLVFESRYKNLGYWQSETDRAIWTFEIPKSGDYDLVVDWASPAQSNKHKAHVEVDDLIVETEIPGTGSWDTYKQATWATFRLEKGPHRLTIRGVRPVAEAIMDLREIKLSLANVSSRRARE